jgi:hypothetical protein
VIFHIPEGCTLLCIVGVSGPCACLQVSARQKIRTAGSITS